AQSSSFAGTRSALLKSPRVVWRTGCCAGIISRYAAESRGAGGPVGTIENLRELLPRKLRSIVAIEDHSVAIDEKRRKAAVSDIEAELERDFTRLRAPTMLEIQNVVRGSRHRTTYTQLAGMGLLNRVSWICHLRCTGDYAGTGSFETLLEQLKTLFVLVSLGRPEYGFSTESLHEDSRSRAVHERLLSQNMK